MTDRWLNLCLDVNSFAQILRAQATNTPIPKDRKFFKSIESVTIEGHAVRVRRIFSSRSVIPQEAFTEFSGLLSSPGSAADEIFDNNQKIENVPKNLDYQPFVHRLNQVVTLETVRNFIEANAL